MFMKKSALTMTNNAVVAGVDYSISSPAICIYDPSSGEFSFENCKLFAATSGFKNPGHYGNIEIVTPTHTPKSEPMARFSELAKLSITFINKYNTQTLAIEDYAFAAKGRVFNIGENCGLLKNELYQNSIPYEVFAPSAIKKFATTKGNAKKDQMIEQFESDTGIDLYEMLGLKRKKTIPHPIDDLVDCFYLCKMLHHNLQNDK